MPQLLLIKIGAIGDCVMALQAVRFFLTRNPEAHLTWVIGASKADLIRSFLPGVKLILVDEQQFYSAGLLGRLYCTLMVALRLFGHRFDRIVVGYRDRRYGFFAAFCRGPRFWFSPTIGQSHISEYFQLLAGEVNQVQWKNLRSVVQNRGPIAIAPGGAKNELRDDFLRRMDLQQYRWIAEYEISRGMEVVIIGASSDEWVKEGFQGLAVRFDFSPRPLLEFFQSLKNYRHLYTHDSGPMHLAILAGTPVTTFFGPTRPDEKVPMNDINVKVVYRNPRLNCQPCYDGKNYAVCTRNECLVWSRDQLMGIMK